VGVASAIDAGELYRKLFDRAEEADAAEQMQRLFQLATSGPGPIKAVWQELFSGDMYEEQRDGPVRRVPLDPWQLDLHVGGDEDAFRPPGAPAMPSLEELLEAHTKDVQGNITRRSYRLPPVLWVNLDRFSFDRVSMRAKKRRARLAFPEVLNAWMLVPPEEAWVKNLRRRGEQAQDLRRRLRKNREEVARRSLPEAHGFEGAEDILLSLVEEQETLLQELEDLEKVMAVEGSEQELLYKLQAVIVHSGRVETGHYYTYARSPPSSSTTSATSWVCLNDDNVTVCSSDEMRVKCEGTAMKVGRPRSEVPAVESARKLESHPSPAAPPTPKSNLQTKQNSRPSIEAAKPSGSIDDLRAKREPNNKDDATSPQPPAAFSLSKADIELNFTDPIQVPGLASSSSQQSHRSQLSKGRRTAPSPKAVQAAPNGGLARQGSGNSNSAGRGGIGGGSAPAAPPSNSSSSSFWQVLAMLFGCGVSKATETVENEVDLVPEEDGSSSSSRSMAEMEAAARGLEAKQAEERATAAKEDAIALTTVAETRGETIRGEQPYGRRAPAPASRDVSDAANPPSSSLSFPSDHNHHNHDSNVSSQGLSGVAAQPGPSSSPSPSPSPRSPSGSPNAAADLAATPQQQPRDQAPAADMEMEEIELECQAHVEPPLEEASDPETFTAARCLVYVRCTAGESEQASLMTSEVRQRMSQSLQEAIDAKNCKFLQSKASRVAEDFIACVRHLSSARGVGSEDAAATLPAREALVEALQIAENVRVEGGMGRARMFLLRTCWRLHIPWLPEELRPEASSTDFRMRYGSVAKRALLDALIGLGQHDVASLIVAGASQSDSFIPKDVAEWLVSRGYIKK